MKKQSGFTLIELLLVLAIIGIISAIAIPALLGQRNRARAKSTMALVSNPAAEAAGTSDKLRELDAAAWTGAGVVNALLALSNYQYPAAKNPYGGVATPYLNVAPANTAASAGFVGLVFNPAFVEPATGSTYPAIVITGTYLDPNNAMAPAQTQKVVALD